MLRCIRQWRPDTQMTQRGSFSGKVGKTEDKDAEANELHAKFGRLAVKMLFFAGAEMMTPSERKQILKREHIRLLTYVIRDAARRTCSIMSRFFTTLHAITRTRTCLRQISTKQHIKNERGGRLGNLCVSNLLCSLQPRSWRRLGLRKSTPSETCGQTTTPS